MVAITSFYVLEKLNNEGMGEVPPNEFVEQASKNPTVVPVVKRFGFVEELRGAIGVINFEKVIFDDFISISVSV